MILPSVFLQYRVSNQISAITYIQVHVSWELKEAVFTIIAPSGSSSQMLSHTKSKATALNHVGARIENVALSDYSNYQTFVPNFR